MSEDKYLEFNHEECPHCKNKINISIYTEVVDRFMVEYTVEVKKDE